MSSAQMNTTLSTLGDNVTHEVYFLEEGTIFLAENCLFKVPRDMLQRNSSVFRDMFSLPSENPQGQSISNPIHLEGIASIDFERLLAFLYPLTVEYCNFTSTWDKSRWVSILKLADLWDMQRVRSLAIGNLDKCASAVAKVTLGRKYDHPKWVLDGFTDLSLRANALTEAEAVRLDLKDVVRCAEVREQFRAQYSYRGPLYQAQGLLHLKDDPRVMNTIRNTFETPPVLGNM